MTSTKGKKWRATNNKSDNDIFFDSLTPKKQAGKALLIVDGEIFFKASSLSEVLKEYSKIDNKMNRDISIIPVQKNKSVMVV